MKKHNILQIVTYRQRCHIYRHFVTFTDNSLQSKSWFRETCHLYRQFLYKDTQEHIIRCSQLRDIHCNSIAEYDWSIEKQSEIVKLFSRHLRKRTNLPKEMEKFSISSLPGADHDHRIHNMDAVTVQ